MTSNIDKSSGGAKAVDALGIKGSSNETDHSIVAPPARRVTITEPEPRPKPPARRRTFTDLFKYGRKLTIYLAIDSRTPIEAKMRIDKRSGIGAESTCKISHTFLQDKIAAQDHRQPHIELRWSPKRDHFAFAPATLFSICNELQNSDCILTREEFNKRSSNLKGRRSWRTFCKSEVPKSFP
jgi:hypothetical protein